MQADRAEVHGRVAAVAVDVLPDALEPRLVLAHSHSSTPAKSSAGVPWLPSTAKRGAAELQQGSAHSPSSRAVRGPTAGIRRLEAGLDRLGRVVAARARIHRRWRRSSTASRPVLGEGQQPFVGAVVVVAGRLPRGREACPSSSAGRRGRCRRAQPRTASRPLTTERSSRAVARARSPRERSRLHPAFDERSAARTVLDLPADLPGLIRRARAAAAIHWELLLPCVGHCLRGLRGRLGPVPSPAASCTTRPERHDAVGHMMTGVPGRDTVLFVLV